MTKRYHIGINFVKEHCCGCTACQSVCGKDAISMCKDEQGFLYPSVDEDKCVNCGMCLTLCPHNSPIIHALDNCYAVKRKDVQKTLTSTSGGFAASLSEYFVKQGGIVYGVCYGDFPHVVHRRAETLSDLEAFKGSKYVQSDPLNTFREVASDLKQGKQVAYFATSCTINGLLLFLYQKHIVTEKLITIDLICHGVPSPGLFEEYIGWLSQKQPVMNYQFRTKQNGWGGGSKNYFPAITYRNSYVCQTPKSLAYLALFFSNNCLRPFCYACPYAGRGRAGDITIADYWKVEQIHPEFYDKAGVSLVFVNTPKGESVFYSLSDIESLPSEIRWAAMGQANMYAPSPISDIYNQFWKEYTQFGIDFVLKKYAYLDVKSRLKWYIKRYIFNKEDGK